MIKSEKIQWFLVSERADERLHGCCIVLVMCMYTKNIIMDRDFVTYNKVDKSA